MIFWFKNALFRLYLKYVEHSPLRKGKEFLGRMLLRIIGESIVDVHGIHFRVGPVARLDRALLSHEDHDNLVFDLQRETLKPGGVFIDIGANIGYFSLLACKIFGARTLAFEPSPRELKRLYENLALNACTAATVMPVALGAEYKTVDLNIAGADNPGMNSFANLSDIRAYVAKARVQVGRLEDFISTHLLKDVQLVKIDVEGYEVDVLQGLDSSMRHMPKAVFVIEISPPYLLRAGTTEQQIYAFFQKHGYRPRFGLQSTSQWDEVFTPTETGSP